MAYRAIQKQRIESGLCYQCGKLRGSDGTDTRCRQCADKGNAVHKHMREQYRLDCRCQDCGVTLPVEHKGRRCGNCQTKLSVQASRRRKERQDSGAACVSCGASTVITDGKEALCETCYFKAVSLRHFGTRTLWQAIEAQWNKQDGVCPYTGLRLMLGKDASLDHTLPTSRFPERHTDPNNWQWVHYRVNEMKKDWTPGEFISFMESILERVGQARWGVTWPVAASVPQEAAAL